ncbi:hypothetical protein K505DRAFT_398635 [Melanomma pulvis-pyrius CBS 109.77]|uniref:DUF6604 domain-containing protein n=1 Tax=Melanomma pulvis-pyrius CBS 109.77 TaxID=1314802 RepID=A0A6A6XNA9_9PLEO|nr:hypothetical protein K505DRAFT_398635 [Melanomma pulvis-pyrius CBS 109.77]
MSLSPLLIDTYRQYKRGTEKFVQWLAETARLTGTVDDIFIDNPDPKKGGRPKGKNRTKAKKSVQSYLVPVKDFTRLATAVVATINSQVPTQMIEILEDVIQARKSCAEWFLANQTDADDTIKAHNETHQFFISVLQEVLQVLKPMKLKEKESVRVENESTDTNGHRLANMFEYLELEEPTESEWLPDIPGHIERKVTPISYKIETSDDEISFAIYCFLKGATDIRVFVRRTWREYKSGNITLPTASLTMNAALKMIENMDETFRGTFPQFKNHADILNFIERGYCHAKKANSDVEDDFFAYKSDGQELSAETMLCCHTTDLLYRFFLSVKEPIYNLEHERLSLDEVALIKCICHLSLLGRFGDMDYNQDQVGRAISIMCTSGNAYTWIVFAVQVFWDTRRELNTELWLGAKALEGIGYWLVLCLDEYLGSEGLNKIGNWHRVHRDNIVKFKEHIQCLAVEDHIQVLIDRNLTHNERKQYEFGGFFLYRNHPALCGLVVQSLLSAFHQAGMNMAGDQGMIMAAAHLYNAAHQTGFLPREVKWVDMDYLIAKQGDEAIFVGGRPKTGREFVSHFKLAFGHGIVQFSKDYNPARSRNYKEGFTRSFGKNRRLLYLSEYAELLVERKSKVGKVIQSSSASRDINIMTDMLSTKFLDTEERSEQGGMANPSPRKSNKRNLTAVQRLMAFKNALKQDEYPIRFNAMSLFLRCIRLLPRIQQDCLNNAPLDYPEAHCSSGMAMIAVVSRLLADSAGVPQLSPSRFSQAIQFLRETIEREGDAESVDTSACLAAFDANYGEDSDEPEPEPTFENPFEDHFSI